MTDSKGVKYKMKTKLLALLLVLPVLLGALGGCTREDGDVIRPSLKAGSMGESLWNTFSAAVEKEPDIDTDALAGKLLDDPTVEFSGGVTPIETETEYFAGFGEYKVEGYEEAAMFAPMIGSIPFVGYVFDLDDDTDPQTFVEQLRDNCDPGWNVCVRAEQTVAGAIGRRVLFVMCPEQSQS